MLDFGSAKAWAHELIERVVTEGSVVVDATMGNGYDTLWLCGLVGTAGRVYAFDIQDEAVKRTAARLEQAGMADRARLLCFSHDRMTERVEEPVDAVVFNLGWLPGADHSITTHTDSTLRAVDAALSLLRDGAVMTICVYPGHEEGARERAALMEWASSLDPKRYDALFKTYLNQPKEPPCLIAVQKKP